MWVVGIFFFQAEDGIRDLVRSRGLGDVYKRQTLPHDNDAVCDVGHDTKIVRDEKDTELILLLHLDDQFEDLRLGGHIECGRGPVSYTHLTLPTSDLV